MLTFHMYDITCDIKGYEEPLKRLLEKLGFKESNGSWQHTISEHPPT